MKSVPHELRALQRLVNFNVRTGNLDRASGSEIVALLEAMNAEGLTLVVVTHDPDVGRRARTRLRMDDGALMVPRTPAQVAS